MKQYKYILILLVALIASVNSYADDAREIKAEKAYKSRNYKESIKIYEEFVDEGYKSYKLYYNLGNAYFKNNQLGKAIYYYELANKLNPNNDDIKNNLRIANEKKIDDIESNENFFVSVIKSEVVSSLSTKGWALLSIIACILFLGLTFLFIISGKVIIKRLSFFLAAACLILFIGSMLLGYTALRNKQQINFAIITTHETKVLVEPNTDSDSKFSLHEGTKVKVLETNTTWTNIKLENGNEGWIKTSDLGLF